MAPSNPFFSNYLQSLSSFFTKVENGLGGAQGWRRYVLAFICGIAATLAMAPYYILPLFVAGYWGLAIMLKPITRHRAGNTKEITSTSLSTLSFNNPLRTAFLTGWAFGFGFFLTGLYWIAFAFLIRGPDFIWMIPIAIPAFALFLGLFMAIPAWALIYLWGHPKAAKLNNSVSFVFLFSVLFSLFEYLRGHILTGLPWNLSGQSLLGIVAGAQGAALFGVYGLGFVLIFLSVLPLIKTNRITLKSFYKNGLVLSVLGLAVLYGGGAIRLINAPTLYQNQIGLIIVQPNILQEDKINPNKASDNFQNLLDTSLNGQRKLGIDRSNQDTPFETIYMVWPENSVPFLGEQPQLLSYLDSILDPKTVLLAGTLRVQAGAQKDEYFNTLAVIDQTSGKLDVSQYYDKHHLVPFGEYLPMQNILKSIGLSQIAGIEEGFKRGNGPSTINAGGTSFAPLICYETIFPNRLYPRTDRPQWLVSVTNDAWFGNNAGPKQHLDQARLRAIESGLPMVRSANTGISALIDPHGRIIKKTSLYQQSALTASLPHPVKPTLYDRYGDKIYFLILFISIIFVMFQIRNPLKTKS